MYKHTHTQTQILLYKYAEIHVYLYEENFNIYINKRFLATEVSVLAYSTLNTAEWIFYRFYYFFWPVHFEKLISTVYRQSEDSIPNVEEGGHEDMSSVQ